jgi:hypothetical protein
MQHLVKLVMKKLWAQESGTYGKDLVLHRPML